MAVVPTISGNIEAYASSSTNLILDMSSYFGPVSNAAAPPVFSVPAGAYTTTQTVTIADETEGAVIYYTTDGSTPTSNSTVYTGPLTILSSETLQAIAIAPGFAQSPVSSSAYTLNISGNVVWINPVSGSWSVASNWSGGAVPVKGNTVTINTAAVTVTL